MALSLSGAAFSQRALNTTLLSWRFPLAGVFIIIALQSRENVVKLSWACAIIIILWCLDALLAFAYGQNLLGLPYDGYRLRGIFYPSHRLGYVTAILSPLLFESIRRYRAHYRLLWLLFPSIVAIIFTLWQS